MNMMTLGEFHKFRNEIFLLKSLCCKIKFYFQVDEHFVLSILHVVASGENTKLKVWFY